VPLATTASVRRTWDQRLVLAFERRYTASLDDVWQGVVDAAWLDEPARIEPVVGGDVSLGSFGSGRVLGLVPRSLLVFTVGDDAFRWEFHASGTGCVVELTDVVADPSGLPARAARLQLALEALAAHLGDATAELPDLDTLVREHAESLNPA
jgi:hypothetical protein